MEKMGVELRFSAEKSTTINADNFQIQRLLTNLITNGINYTPENGFVHIQINKAEDTAQIVVRNSGFGIHEEQITQIFTRYFRVTDHKSRAQGAELGLSIVKAIVDAHQGAVELTSEVDKGSRFSVTLPIA